MGEPHDRDDELELEERRALRALRTEVGPPADLEDAVSAAARERGLFTGARAEERRGASGWLWPAAGVAAAVLAFAGGIAVGRAAPADAGGAAAAAPPADASASPAAAPAGERWLLLLIDGPGYRPPEPGQEEARVGEYVAWARRLGAEGRLVAADELAPDGALLAGDDAASAPAAAGDRLGAVSGFFLITADTREEAVGIARTSPHLRHGGEIAVREVIEH